MFWTCPFLQLKFLSNLLFAFLRFTRGCIFQPRYVSSYVEVMSNSETLFLYTTGSFGPKLFRAFPIDTVFPSCRCISATNEPQEPDLQQRVPFRKCSIEEMGIFRNVYFVQPLWHNTIAEFGHRETNRTVQSSGQNTRTVDLMTNHCSVERAEYGVISHVRAYVQGTSRTPLKEFCGTAWPEEVLHICRSIVPKGELSNSLSKLMRLHIPEVF